MLCCGGSGAGVSVVSCSGHPDSLARVGVPSVVVAVEQE